MPVPPRMQFLSYFSILLCKGHDEVTEQESNQIRKTIVGIRMWWHYAEACMSAPLHFRDSIRLYPSFQHHVRETRLPLAVRLNMHLQICAQKRSGRWPMKTPKRKCDDHTKFHPGKIASWLYAQTPLESYPMYKCQIFSFALGASDVLEVLDIKVLVYPPYRQHSTEQN